MYGVFDLFLWLTRVLFALLKGYGLDLAAVLAALLVSGCTLVYVPADTRWTVQAGDGGTAASLERQKE